MDQQFVITSYNIRKAVGLDWKRDPNRILQILDDTGAQIVVLQEADKRLGQRHSVFNRKTLTKQHHYQIAPLAQNAYSLGWHGNAILVKKPFKIIDCLQLQVPHFEPRGAVSVRLGQKHGPDLEIIGVHLGLARKSRRKQIEYLRDYIRGRDHDLPLIMAGDFNEWKPVSNLEEQVGEELRFITPGYSFHTSRPRAALDHFLISDEIKNKGAKVFRSDLSRVASDHFPITMKFTIKS